MSTEQNVVQIKWLDKAAARRILEKRAQRVLGVSAAALRKQLTSGKYSRVSIDRKPGLMALATLCSFAGNHGARKNRSGRS